MFLRTMKPYTFFCLFCFFVLSGTAFSQQQQLSSKNKKAVKLFLEADQLFHDRQFDPGIQKLKQALSKDPDFVEAYLKLGSAYKLFGKNLLAMDCYLKASEIKPNDPKMAGAYFAVGQYYFDDGDYEKARSWFHKVQEVKPEKKALSEQAADLEKRADFGIQATNHPVTFVPRLMPDQINAYFIMAYPVLTADQSTLIFSKRNGPTPQDDEDIMISRKVNGAWTSPVSVSPAINTQFNEGACTMSADGKTLVFASCNRPEGLGSCDLYISYKQGGQWSAPENLGKNVNSGGWESEPTLSADGKTIYFTSERGGGLGKFDIWVTHMKEDGEWTVAKNLGAPINTKGREVSPFIHADGKTLYFSSDEHIGLGEYDIFVSKKLDSVQWSEPKNLGYPINSSISDASVFITADNSKGMFSKYEKKERQYSKSLLYEFEVPDEIKPDKISTYARGKVYDAETRKPIHAEVRLVDLKTNRVIQRVESDPETGEYLIVLTEGSQYALYVDEDKYLFKSQYFDYENASGFDPVNLDIYLEPLKQGNTVVLNNLFFASNSYTLEDKSKTELDKIALFLKKNPEVKIEFGGHTDNVGSEADNMQLSLKRAEAVYRYIISLGISSSRLRYKGYGETHPVASNDTDAGRQSNRRIEFKVL